MLMLMLLLIEILFQNSLSVIIKKENITADNEDYEKLAEENSAKYNIPVDKLIEASKENEEVKMKIMNDKVLDVIISNAKITETEELKKKENSDIEP